MGRIFVIYVFVKCPFLGILAILAILSFAVTMMQPYNIGFVMDALDLEVNTASDFLYLFQNWLNENTLYVFLSIFLVTTFSILYVRYQIIGYKVVALCLIMFYVLNFLCLGLHVIFGDKDKGQIQERYLVQKGESSSQEKKVIQRSGLPSTTFVDSRDGNEYRVVKLGNLIWFAENARYNSENSYCYKNKEEYCQKYGRLYPNKCSIKICKTLLDVCPEGWHIPTNFEWGALIDSAGGRAYAGKILKSSFGWRNGKNGIDSLGFSVIPVPDGDKKHLGDMGKGTRSCFWWQTKNSPYSKRESYVGIKCFDLSDSLSISFPFNADYYGMHPVRCVYELPNEEGNAKKLSKKKKADKK